MQIFDTELRSFFFNSLKDISNLNRELIYKKKNFLVNLNINKLKLKNNFLEKNITKALVTSLPYNDYKNLIKQDNYFKETFNNKDKFYCLLSVCLNKKNYEIYEKFLFKYQNYKFYRGVELLYDIHDNIVDINKIISFLKKCEKKNLIVKIWPVHCGKMINSLPQLRGTINEVYYIVSKLRKPVILGGMGCGMINYLFFQKTNKILNQTFFSTSIPFSLNNLNYLNKRTYSKIFFGSDYPFTGKKNFNQIVNEHKKNLPPKEISNVFFNNANNFLNHYNY